MLPQSIPALSSNRGEQYCAEQVQTRHFGLSSLFFSGTPRLCDFCQQPLANGQYFADCQIPLGRQWGHLCQDCITRHELKFAWGEGQLYERCDSNNNVWLLVAGFPESDELDHGEDEDGKCTK